LAHKIDEFVKSKKTMTIKTLGAKMIMNDKKNAMKQARWDALPILEKTQIALVEKKPMIELIADQNRTMMIDPSDKDAYTREWSDMRRLEIIKRRRQAHLDASASCGAGGGYDGDTTASGGVGRGEGVGAPLGTPLSPAPLA
jgi:hypothetical protein